MRKTISGYFLELLEKKTKLEKRMDESRDGDRFEPELRREELASENEANPEDIHVDLRSARTTFASSAKATNHDSIDELLAQHSLLAPKQKVFRAPSSRGATDQQLDALEDFMGGTLRKASSKHLTDDPIQKGK